MNRVIDLTGQRFGRLEVLGRAPNPAGMKRAWWLVRCECGTVRPMRSWSLRDGNTSCGCQAQAVKLGMTGRRFGRLVVLEYAGNQYWRCRCDCGNETTAHGRNLRCDRTRSCGIRCALRSPKKSNAAQTGSDMMLKRIEIQAGDKYSFLTALREAGSNSSGSREWWFRCDCGKEVSKSVSNVVREKQKTCGASACTWAVRRQHGAQRNITPVKPPPRRLSDELKFRPPAPPVDPLQRFRTIATALGHDADALLLEFADAWLAPIVEAHGKRPDAPVSTLAEVRQS